ncbi:aspartate kinase [Vulcanimicrobium alpinum]|uniref:Aspartokinase n=1 Tax=Vulcanimicrobium alpinum TaxID=3016050 RepID=A0AAN2C9T3_UNVUL|nr:aspartate kinase [Vulcanimicrobium alpinum]BDE05937.1 aspartate kinase [Vulcanimicrobium alpinum]
MNVVVIKFGGSSLSTPELREIAASRVLDSVRRGEKPVVVCSAMGRAPEPYATDSLASLLGPVRGGPNRDLLIACGETISCAVFAELLTALGFPAQAMTGMQAGIVTDERFGDAEIVQVDPGAIRALLARDVIPVVTGFQGGTRDGAITTLGRGGSDLTAVALGDALGASSVEIYTDVSGVMTADPRRVAGAHALDRVTQREMVELAGNGAKVMHHKAAELAHATATPYAVKGLRSNVGTTVDDGAPVDPDRPVTGLAVIPDVTFCRIIQGLTDDLDRADVDRDVLARIAERGISIDMINVNDAGVFFICDDEAADAIRPALSDLNLALRMRPHCAKISIVGAGMRGTSGVMYRVVRTITDAGVDIIHSTDSNITISILVPADQAVQAEQALHDAFGLGQGAVAR